MKKLFAVKLILMVVFALAAAGCTLPSRQTGETADPAAAFTQAAQTIVAELTLGAPSQPSATAALPSALPLPSDTLAPTETSAPSQTPTAEPTATATSAPEPTQPPTYAFFDNFEEDFSWYTAEGEDFSFDYSEDGYKVVVNLISAPIWSVRDQTYADVRLEVEARSSAGSQEVYYGLVCRHSGDGATYYAFLVGPDGEYGIGKRENGEFEFLDRRTDGGGIIDGGNGVNRIGATCLGDSLELFVNGQKLMEVVDDDLLEGVVGVIVLSRQVPGVEVIFDNFGIIE